MGQEVSRGRVWPYSFILLSMGLQNGFLQGNGLPAVWHAHTEALRVVPISGSCLAPLPALKSHEHPPLSHPSSVTNLSIQGLEVSPPC